MILEPDALPAKPFFTCSPEGLVIVEGGQMTDLSRLASIEPWMIFKNGENNVVDGTPSRVASWQGQQITVECENSTVHIDRQLTNPDTWLQHRGRGFFFSNRKTPS